MSSVFNFNEADDAWIPSDVGIAGIGADLLIVINDAAAGTFVGRVEHDLPSGRPTTFSIIGGNTEGAFSIDANGDISTTVALDAITEPIRELPLPFMLDVEVSNGIESEVFCAPILVQPRFGEPGFSSASSGFTPDFSIPESTSPGTLIGTLSILVSLSGTTADQYEMAGVGDSSGISVESNGNVFVATDLDFESKPFFVFDVKATDTTTGNSVIQTICVDVTDDPSDDSMTFRNGAPKPFSADTLVTKLGWTTIPATRFSDLNGKIQLALVNRRGILYDGDGKYTTPYGTAQGPYPADSSHGRWETKLNHLEGESAYNGFYGSFGLKGFFNQLRGAARKAEFAWFSFTAPSAMASYVYGTHTIRLPLFGGGVPNVDESTVLHESVHILDDFSPWSYLNAGNRESAEALAYGTEKIIYTLKTFRALEEYLKNSNLAVTEGELRNKWYGLVTVLEEEMFDVDVVWNSGSSVRKITPADYSDISAKLGLKIAAGGVAGIYGTWAANRGVTFDFPLTNVTDEYPNNPIRNVPTVFQ